MKNLSRTLFVAALLTPLLASAQILPERLGDFNRTLLEAAPIEDTALYTEFDFEEGERGVFETPDGRKAEITAYRFYDDTGAYSAFLWGVGDNGGEDSYGERAWVSPGRNWIHFGNYVVEILGDMPEDEHVEQMMGQYFPSVRMSADPPVIAYLPPEGRVSTADRYILGPVALERVASEVPPSVAGFHFGTEVIYSAYDSDEGRQRLALFSYPTPQMAREQIEKFHALDAVVAKRDGSVIAAVLAPQDPDAAQVLLSQFRYRAEVTMNYNEPGRHDNFGTFLLDVVISCFILVGLCIMGGIFMAGGRLLASRVAPNSIFASSDEAVMTRLELDENDRFRK